ncbi:hypothetical protein DSUL_60228 [Desulfovibrionales bacterium]
MTGRPGLFKVFLASILSKILIISIGVRTTKPFILTCHCRYSILAISENLQRT